MKDDQEFNFIVTVTEKYTYKIKAASADAARKIGEGRYETGAGPDDFFEIVDFSVEEISDKPVSDLVLSVRSRRALYRLHAVTVGHVAGLTEDDLRATKGVGNTTVNEIKRRLAELGLALKPSNEH